MYSATLLLFMSMPLVLGAPFSFAITLTYVPIIAKRIRNEEAVLNSGLAGCADHLARTRWRLVPHVW